MVRKTLFWIHLAAGLLAAVPMAVMALTGILLSFEHQIAELATREAVVVGSARGARLPLDTLVARAAGKDAARVTGVQILSDPLRTVELRLGREAKLRVDPWTGEVREQGKRVESAFAPIERIHRWLGSRGIGGVVTGVSVLLCLVLCTTGLVIWWPRNLRALGKVLWPRRGLSGKARDWQWHNSVGVLALPLLLSMALTGTVMSWKWAEAALYAVAGSESPKRPPVPSFGGPAKEVGKSARDRNWQAWMDTAMARAPSGWTAVSLSAPQKPGFGASALFRASKDPVPSGGSVVLRADGGFASWKPARADLGTRLRSMVKPLHTGELFGWPGQLAMALGSLGALVLVWTGVALGWRRLARAGKA